MPKYEGRVFIEDRTGTFRHIHSFYGRDKDESLDRAKQTAEALTAVHGYKTRADVYPEGQIEVDQVWIRKRDKKKIRIIFYNPKNDDVFWHEMGNPRKTGGIYGYNLRRLYERAYQ